MRTPIFIWTFIIFLALGGSVVFLIDRNRKLKAENDELKAHSANKDGLQRTDNINSYY